MTRAFSILAVLALLAPCSHAYAAERAVDLVRVTKAERRMELLAAGEVVHVYSVALGGNPVGPKREEGDSRTPEGRYLLDWRNANSAYYRSIHISYPDAADRRAAALRGVDPGGAIMIHGQRNGFGWLSWLVQRFDWTDGCIAVTNSEMDEIWRLVKNGTPIEILP